MDCMADKMANVVSFTETCQRQRSWWMIAFAWAFLVLAGPVFAADTSLMFVGEDLSVLTIASRRPEREGRAPAVAKVVSRDDFQRRGARTVAEILAAEPGFAIAPQEWGSRTWLRGSSDSVLFLYNSTPLTSDSTKSIQPIDEEISLAAVKRIEIIRGPGSVFWGPDASAGLVNIVPLSGRDLNGFEIKAHGSGGQGLGEGFSAVWGKNAGLWEGLLAVSGSRSAVQDDQYNLVRLTDGNGSLAPLASRLGAGEVDGSDFYEGLFNASWQDWLHVTGRWSDSTRRYVHTSSDSSVRWAGSRETPFRFLRVETEKQLTRTKLRFNSYYTELDYQEQQVDLEPWHQTSAVSYAEFLYDREFLDASALLTLGVSYRQNQVDGAIIAKPYPPDFAVPGNIFFLPVVSQESFKSELTSAFGQLRRNWGRLEGWAGLRVDRHSQYDQSLSNTLGAGWTIDPAWRLKLLYGDAYRTPYNLQLVGISNQEPEQVQSLSADLNWQPITGLSLSAIPFLNRLRYHIQEDSRAGLSEPGSTDITGVEFVGQWQASQALRLWFNATALTHSGDPSVYLNYSWVLVNGSFQKILSGSQHAPYEAGPDNLFNAGMTYSYSSELDFDIGGRYGDSALSSYVKDDVQVITPSAWVVDATVNRRNIFGPGLDLQLAVKNIFDRRYQTPGVYGPVEGALPFTAVLQLTWRH